MVNNLNPNRNNNKEAFSPTNKNPHKINNKHNLRLHLSNLKSTLIRNLFSNQTLIKINFSPSSLRITSLNLRASFLIITTSLKDSNQPQIHPLINPSSKTRPFNKTHKLTNNLTKLHPKESILFSPKKTSMKAKTHFNPKLT